MSAFVFAVMFALGCCSIRHESAPPPSQAGLQVESYIESLRRRSKVRLRTTSSTTSGSPPVSRWSRGGSAASGGSGSSSGGNYMADLSAAARDAAQAAAAADAAAPPQPSAQDAAATGSSALKSASLRTPSVVLPLPAVQNGPTAPATAAAVLAAATPAGHSAPEQSKALLPTSEAVSAVSSYLDSLRGLSARGVSSGQMGGLLTASQSQHTTVRHTSALSMPGPDPDPMPRSQTTPEAAAAAAVGGYLASLRSQSQMHGAAGGALPWQRVHALVEGANPQRASLTKLQTDAAKTAKAAAVAAAMFGGGEDDDDDDDDEDEEEEGDGAFDAGEEEGPPRAAGDPDVNEGDGGLRTDSLACLSLRDDPSTAGQFSVAAMAAVASVRAQSQLRSASVLPSGASRGRGSAQEQHRSHSGSQEAGELATDATGGVEGIACSAASGVSPPGDDGNDDPAIKRDSACSDSSAAPFKVAYSPFTAMAEAASKSSSASSEGNPRSDGAQVIACAPSHAVPAALPAPQNAWVTTAKRASTAR